MAITVTTKTPTEKIDVSSAVSGGSISGDQGAYNELVDLLIKGKFQFSVKTRQKIVASVTSIEILSILRQFTDSKQNNMRFILTGVVHDVLHDSYDIELTEYDNSSEINLILS